MTSRNWTIAGAVKWEGKQVIKIMDGNGNNIREITSMCLCGTINHSLCLRFAVFVHTTSTAAK